ncbi:hypothetical protein ACSQ67_025705 [Phaseolus vulgaris]
MLMASAGTRSLVMAENKDETYSETSECSSALTMPMATKCRYLFHRLCGSTNSWNKSTPKRSKNFPQGCGKRRIPIYTAKSLNSLAYGLRYELLQRPVLRMWNILNSTSEITTAQVKLSQYVIRRHSNPATQAEQVELYEAMRAVTWALFASRKALNSITINYKNGFVHAFHRDLKDNNTFYIYSDLSNYSMGASNSNEVNSVSTHQAWDDKALRGNYSAIWYREPLDHSSWHVSVSKFTDSPLLSAALPVWDSSNKTIMAVVGSQLHFIVAPLLANSTKPKLKMAVDCEDDIIRQGAEWLQRTYGNNFPPSHEVHVENVKLGQKTYYIDSFFLHLKRLPLVGVIIIPRKYIMGQVDERAFKTLVILISASLCILVIGHELRTPMAAVIGLLDILISDDCLTNEQYSTVTQIRKCSTALLRLLNNILDLSKCINYNVETVLDLSDDMPKIVRGDSARVVQIFANLINNSIKFTPSGHIVLRGWSEIPNSSVGSPNFPLDQKKLWSLQKCREKPNANHSKKASIKDNKVILWFEVEDTAVVLTQASGIPCSKALSKLIHLLLDCMEALVLFALSETCAPMDITEQQCAVDLTDSGLVREIYDEFLEIDSTHFDAASSDDSDLSDIAGSNPVSANGDKPVEKLDKSHPSSPYHMNNCLDRLTNANECLEENNLRKKNLLVPAPIMPLKTTNLNTDEDSECRETHRVTSSSKAVDGKKSLEGLKILLAEDTPVLQRVATIMLEKMGADVVAVGDGQQAVEALSCMFTAEDCRRESLQKERNTRSQTEILTSRPYDLILMDCQMPKMDGYEATKEIRKSEVGTSLHIPIVALTAHAMSCDEAKCLDVGMDAYLTKPIDFKMMVSTILSLTKTTS